MITLDPNWIDAFEDVFARSAIGADTTVAILRETQSRAVNHEITVQALARRKATYFTLTVPTPTHPQGPIMRSTGASRALTGQDQAVAALAAADVVIDLSLEGLMHAPQTPKILKGGARILNISNEHPDALARLLPNDDLKAATREAVARCKSAKEMRVTSEAGTDLTVNMENAPTVGIWGWTDRPGTLAHWPGGIVVSFPAEGATNGRLVFQPGDMNLTFKRYFEAEVQATLKADYVTDIMGQSTDAKLMRDYLESWGDPKAYATSHVGWGLNPAARWEALSIYDKADCNGTELRAVAGNFLYSTGANEFAGRYTDGHFDLPMMGCTISLDGSEVVANGKLVG